MNRHLFISPFFLFVSLFLSFENVSADEVIMINDDRLTGTIVEESQEGITIETEALGTLSINRKFVKQVVREEKAVEVVFEEDKVWEKEISIGYSKSSGNTQNRQLQSSLYANRKTAHDEFTVKGNSSYASSNKKMDTQKWSGSMRYAFSFWEKKWYDFYKLEGDHNRFADVDYRITPSIGIGYWFSDESDWKAMAEIGIGLEHTDFRGASEDSDEAVIIPRVFFEKRLFKQSRIREDIYIYPSLDDVEEFRLHSETVFENPINDKLSLRLSLIDDYDSDPANNAKKNDTCFTSSLVYSF
ncbi:MAG: DUF481 domain-containing protein [Candidatus Omnitrophica bacterium]|nr:DUF481 domain-containing protein [Candidatus Omnitrophota bacterium]